MAALQVTVICRGKDAFRGTRLILNQEEVIQALRMVEVSSWSGGVIVSKAVMEEMTWSEKLSIVVQSDVLIGMHGAGDSFAIFAPQPAATPKHAILRTAQVHAQQQQ